MERPCYPNDRPKVGLVEIINNVDTEIVQSQIDLRDVVHAFRWIGMDVKRPNFDLIEDEMKTKLDHILLSERSLKEYNMMVLIIICHQNKNTLLMSADGKPCSGVPILVDQMTNLEDMKGRPKVLIIVTPEKDLPNSIPESRPDLLIASGSIDSYEGSSFLQILTQKMLSMAETDHLEKIVLEVEMEIGKTEHDRNSQMVLTKSTLKKEVRLCLEGKTYIEERFNGNGIKYRLFGNPNGWGNICSEYQNCLSCNFENGEISYVGKVIIEGSGGDVIEINLDPESKFEKKFNGQGVMYNIRRQWRYEGYFQDGLRHGGGTFYFQDGTFHIANKEAEQCLGPRCLISKGDDVIDFEIFDRFV